MLSSLELIYNNIDCNGDIVLLKSTDVEIIKEDLQVFEFLLKYLHLFSDTARNGKKYQWFDLIIASDKIEFEKIKKHLKKIKNLKRVSVV